MICCVKNETLQFCLNNKTFAILMWKRRLEIFYVKIALCNFCVKIKTGNLCCNLSLAGACGSILHLHTTDENHIDVTFFLIMRTSYWTCIALLSLRSIDRQNINIFTSQRDINRNKRAGCVCIDVATYTLEKCRFNALIFY